MTNQDINRLARKGERSMWKAQTSAVREKTTSKLAELELEPGLCLGEQGQDRSHGRGSRMSK